MKSDLTIQEVSDRLGLPKSTLRYWEKELRKHIQPKRTPGGQRRYEEEHVELFKRVRGMRNEGLTLSKIKRAFLQPSNQNSSISILSNTSVDSLAQRIAELVKHEVSIFLSGDKA